MEEGALSCGHSVYMFMQMNKDTYYSHFQIIIILYIAIELLLMKLLLLYVILRR